MKMEAHALTMLTLTRAPAGLVSLVSTVKPTSQTALKGEALNQTDFFLYFSSLTFTHLTHLTLNEWSHLHPILPTVHALMEGRALTKSMATCVRAALALLGPTASMRSMNVIPSPASMGESVKMLSIPSDAPAPKVFSAIAVRYCHTPACQALLSLYI